MGVEYYKGKAIPVFESMVASKSKVGVHCAAPNGKVEGFMALPL